jgi:hypothetical protein
MWLMGSNINFYHFVICESSVFHTIWLCHNSELLVKDKKEQQSIALQTTRDPDNPELTTTLHLQPITEVLKWMKCHLDAYLATAEVYLEQSIDPG